MKITARGNSDYYNLLIYRINLVHLYTCCVILKSTDKCQRSDGARQGRSRLDPFVMMFGVF